MRINLSSDAARREFTEKVEVLSGENVYACYQCGKCSAGCPVTSAMDILPNQVIRLVQLGDENVLDCKTIWICASCFTCVSRCPKGVDLAKVMEALRQITLRKNVDQIPGVFKLKKVSHFPQIALISALRKFSS